MLSLCATSGWVTTVTPSILKGFVVIRIRSRRRGWSGAARRRVCDLGYLLEAYRKEDGTIGVRCASEPDREFLKKGGEACEISGRKCLCNALSGTIGMAQANKDGYTEKAVVTTGDQVKKLADFLPPGTTHYSANLVIDYLLQGAS